MDWYDGMGWMLAVFFGVLALFLVGKLRVSRAKAAFVVLTTRHKQGHRLSPREQLCWTNAETILARAGEADVLAWAASEEGEA